MDDEAFLPLRSEELTGTIPRRILQFNRLVDDLYNLLANEGIADGRRLRSAAGSGWYGRYFRVHGVPCLLHVNAWRWGRDGFTPLWLRVLGRDWHPSPEVGRALSGLQARSGLAVLAAPEGHEIPLLLPVGVELDEIVRELRDRLRTVAGALAPLGWRDAGDATPPAVQDLQSGGADDAAAGLAAQPASE